MQVSPLSFTHLLHAPTARTPHQRITGTPTLPRTRATRPGPWLHTRADAAARPATRPGGCLPHAQQRTLHAGQPVASPRGARTANSVHPAHLTAPDRASSWPSDWQPGTLAALQGLHELVIIGDPSGAFHSFALEAPLPQLTSLLLRRVSVVSWPSLLEGDHRLPSLVRLTPVELRGPACARFFQSMARAHALTEARVRWGRGACWALLGSQSLRELSVLDLPSRHGFPRLPFGVRPGERPHPCLCTAGGVRWVPLTLLCVAQG